MNANSAGKTSLSSGWLSELVWFMVSMAIFAIFWTTLAGVLQGRYIAEKVATGLVQPAGFLWALLFALVVLAVRRKQWRLAGGIGAAWCLLTLGGNGLLSGAALRHLEGPYLDCFPLHSEAPYDAVVLLGGGTSIRPTGEPQLGAAGDRVMMAARLYHQGLAGLVICTGEPLRATPELQSLGQSTKQLLRQVGVAEEALQELPGRNTAEEMVAIREWLEQNPDVQRLGIITSAWHMPRVESLAERAKVPFEPVPCDYISHQEWDLRAVVPSGGAMAMLGMAMKEFLGRAIGR